MSGLALLLGAVALGGCDAGSPSALEPMAGGPEAMAVVRQALSYGDHTYSISTTPRTWADAYKDCADQGLGMVSLNDAAEEQWLRSQMQTVASEWWLGINDRGQEGSWVWADEPSTYAHWNPGEPNGATSAEDCGVVTSAGGWNDIPCTLTRPYVCESVPITRAQFNGHEYRFHAVRTPWAQARNICLGDGFDLVTIDDAAEDTWLKQQVPTGRTSFIGFNDLARPGTWAWSDGSPVSYLNWRRYEPNNANGIEHCAVNNAPTTSSAAGGGWNDIPCTEYSSFICERAGLPSGYQAFVYSATETADATQSTTDIEVWLEPGQTLELGTCGMPTATALNDTSLRLLGPDGQEVAANDDACKGSGSHLRYRVPVCEPGRYVIRAGCFGATACGGQLVYRVIPPPPIQP